MNLLARFILYWGEARLPLSPNPFRMYVDELGHMFTNVHQHDAPCSCQNASADSVIADNVVLIFNSQDGIQVLLDKLALFCEKMGSIVHINNDNHKAFVLGSRSALRLLGSFSGMHIEKVNYFRYLGLDFHQNGL
jgi:hypothetical protein